MKSTEYDEVFWVTTEHAEQGGTKKRYLGCKTTKETIVLVHHGALVYPLNPRFDLRRHSPAGFNWGYGGSGPAQLALAILCDNLADDGKAMELYQQFKFSIIGGLKGPAFVVTEEMIDEFLRVIEDAQNVEETPTLFEEKTD